MTVQQVLDWQPFTSFSIRDEDRNSGVVLTLTTVFTPDGGGTNVMTYFTCEPEQAWAQIEATLGRAFERSSQRLSEILATRTDSI